jgi:hypothetical protein
VSPALVSFGESKLAPPFGQLCDVVARFLFSSIDPLDLVHLDLAGKSHLPLRKLMFQKFAILLHAECALFLLQRAIAVDSLRPKGMIALHFNPREQKRAEFILVFPCILKLRKQGILLLAPHHLEGVHFIQKDLKLFL